MTPRHAATLALVGWYLLLPPQRQPSLIARASAWALGTHLVKEFDSNAPIATWVQLDEFESRNDCESQLTHLNANANLRIQAIYAHKNITQEDLDAEAYLGRVLFARCISSDDPRLKEK
jgi:hypothetical protein